jgi:hypothetical protein
MSRKNWKRVWLSSNGEEPIQGWQLGKYTICLNLNKGSDVKTGHKDRHGHRWWFEITEAVNGHGLEKTVGEAPTVEDAKALVKKLD